MPSTPSHQPKPEPNILPLCPHNIKSLHTRTTISQLMKPSTQIPEART
jgi:hypothetical protein